MRLNQVPEIETVLIQNGHYPAGTGEPATTVVAPAIANAIDNAVGARVRLSYHSRGNQECYERSKLTTNNLKRERNFFTLFLF